MNELQREILDKQHEILQQFLETSRYKKRRFALVAGIEPRTFQNMLSRKSKIRMDTAIKISTAMLQIIYDETAQWTNECKEELQRLQEQFIEKTLQFIDKNEPQNNIAKKICDAVALTEKRTDYTFNSRQLATAWANLSEQERQEIMSAANDVANENLKSQKMNLQLFAGKDNRSRLLDAFDRMNEKGQSVAADRVEELSKIPDYQKPDEN